MPELHPKLDEVADVVQYNKAKSEYVEKKLDDHIAEFKDFRSEMKSDVTAVGEAIHHLTLLNSKQHGDNKLAMEKFATSVTEQIRASDPMVRLFTACKNSPKMAAAIFLIGATVLFGEDRVAAFLGSDAGKAVVEVIKEEDKIVVEIPTEAIEEQSTLPEG